MSGTANTGPQPDEASTGVPQSHTARLLGRGRIIAALVVLTALGLTLAYTLWWTQPSTFTNVGNGFGFRQSVDTTHPVTVDMVQLSGEDEGETITLHEVEPRVRTNTADALITFIVCGQDPDYRFASMDGTAERSCETVDAVEDQRVRLAVDSTTTITMTLTPRRQGRVVIRGMNVTYARDAGHLWQHGSQATGPVVKMKVTN